MEITAHEYIGDGSAWDSYVIAHRDSSNYHLYKWRNVVEKSFGHSTMYLIATDPYNKICGVLPLVLMKSWLFGSFWVSLPFFNYGGMLVSKKNVVTTLLETARKMLLKTGDEFIELRHRVLFDEVKLTKQSKVSMVLDLMCSEAGQWECFDSKVRNQVRKAQKNGLKSVVGHTELLDGFYDVFCRNMRDLGTPVYSRSFFSNMLEAFPESTRILSITLEGKTVASAFLTWYKENLEVPWASSVKDYRALCPNNLLYWEAIRFAIQRGFSQFDFGRSTPKDGTYEFKKQWGAKPKQLYWQYLLHHGEAIPEINRKNSKFQLAIWSWKQLPLIVTNYLGPRIVRNIP